MKIVSIVTAAMLVLAPTVGLAGEAERDNQVFGGSPETVPEFANLPPDATAALPVAGIALLIGGAAVGLASGGGNNAPVGTTSTTSTTSTTTTN